MSRVLKILLGVALLGQGVMAAQPPATPAGAPPPGGTPPAAAVPPPAGTPPADTDISVRQRPSLSPQDMMTQAREYRSRMDVLVKELQELIQKAQDAKDVIRLNCLSDKLAQLKANIAVADKGLQDLQDAILRRDEGASVHEYSRITIINQKAQALGAEGQACVGEDLAFVGATRLEVEAPDVPEGSLTDPPPPAPPNFVVDRPPSASPMGDG
jgi:hypothetical protein